MALNRGTAFYVAFSMILILFHVHLNKPVIRCCFLRSVTTKTGVPRIILEAAKYIFIWPTRCRTVGILYIICHDLNVVLLYKKHLHEYFLGQWSFGPLASL